MAAQQQSSSCSQGGSKDLQQLPASYSDYEQKTLWAVMAYVRKRIKANRFIMSCQDLGRQFMMNPEAVEGLIKARLRENEFAEWERLSKLSPTLPTSRAVPGMRKRPNGTQPARPKAHIIKHIKARGWERYPEALLNEFLEAVWVNMVMVDAGVGIITSYYKLRERFPISVGVMGDFLRYTLGDDLFEERKRLSKIRR